MKLIKVVFKKILSFPCKTASVVVVKISIQERYPFVYLLLANVIPFKHIRGGGGGGEGGGSGLQKMFFGPSGLSLV